MLLQVSHSVYSNFRYVQSLDRTTYLTPSIFILKLTDLAVVEFQKRGLQHSHILITLHEQHKLKSTKQIDDVICAEIPEEQKDPFLHLLVKTHMIHGPCGEHNPSSSCMRDGKGTKGFPKPYNDFTTIDAKGFLVY